MHGSRSFFDYHKLITALLLLSSLAFFGCSGKTPPAPRIQPQVTMQESASTFLARLRPANQGLKSWKDLAPSLKKSLAFTRSKPGNAMAVERPGLSVSYGELKTTIERLLALLPRLDAEPWLLAEHFYWEPINGGIMYSGYYEPTVRASRTKKPGYEQAIYMVPPDLHKVKAKRGRYHDRRTIEEDQVLAGRGLELAWAADPVDVFFLEIQGSGKLVFDDGTEQYVNYAGQNGHKYKSSGRIMREKGLLSRGDIFEQRQWFRDHPERVREILHENPSYVFFRFGNRGSVGAMGHTIDAWQSLATSRPFIPMGSVVAYGVNIPDEKLGTVPLRGIGLSQDIGGAIKGNRIDIFCGNDYRANYVASHLDASGPAWVLLAKPEQAGK